jgi:hypothetical protein
VPELRPATPHSACNESVYMNPINQDLSGARTTPPTDLPGFTRRLDPNTASTIRAEDTAIPSPTTFQLSRPRLIQSTLLGALVGGALGRVARVLSPRFVERSLTAARNTGQYAVLAGAGLTLLYAIFAAIKFNSFGIFLTGIGLIAAIAVGQFAAIRFLHAADSAIVNTPSRISSPAFLECTGLLVLLMAAAVLVGGIITSIQLSSFATLMPAVLMAATLAYFGAVALHPALVNVEVGEGSAGEEAIGLLSFFFKSGLKLVPLFFCLLAIGGCLAITASFFQAGQAFASVIGSVVQNCRCPTHRSASPVPSLFSSHVYCRWSPTSSFCCSISSSTCSGRFSACPGSWRHSGHSNSW